MAVLPWEHTRACVRESGRDLESTSVTAKLPINHAHAHLKFKFGVTEDMSNLQ